MATNQPTVAPPIATTTSKHSHPTDDVTLDAGDIESVRFLADDDVLRTVFASAVKQGPTDDLEDDLVTRLTELGYETEQIVAMDARMMLVAGAGYMVRAVESHYDRLERIESAIAVYEDLRDERREERDQLFDEQYDLRKLTGVKPRVDN
ncbi:hypothetical protein [Haloferax sulfurifontis]|uniref:Uncharacterized protein n=1 Tax=Haloferax sulfurifontis TaxID=255616 RepID=A0A830DXH0_9EURY|nr:hypothetical protein [Haloferax sulfurifontis]GGC72385.1 hypothetical protein GCM10007209_37880 [Haloferax sulfurifontis]